MEPPNYRKVTLDENGMMVGGCCNMCKYRRIVEGESSLICIRAPHLKRVLLFDVCDDYMNFALERPMEWFPPIAIEDFDSLQGSA